MEYGKLVQLAKRFKVAEADRAALESWLRAPSMAQEQRPIPTSVT
jgi:hypothetical protein